MTNWCPCKMNKYLAMTLSKLRTNNFTKLNIVLGNESCDLDSAVSALVYAMFLNWAYKEKHLNDDNIYIGMLDVAKEDYPIKTEVAYSLKEHGIEESNLIFRDNIDLNQLVKSGQTNITLVDHHILPKRLDYLRPYVTEIIDHRSLDQKEWRYNDNVNNLITIVGSCCTLVTQKIREFVSSNVFFDTFPVCADLLYDVIILDTANFSKEINKATPLDEDAAAYLENILKIKNSQLDSRKVKFDRLLKARSDVTMLSASQLLRKDLKICGDVFVPSFPILVKVLTRDVPKSAKLLTVQEFLKKPKALEAVTDTLKSHNCTLALLLGMDLTGTLKRDVAIVSPVSPRKEEKLAEFLQQWSSTAFKLVSESEVCLYFKQMNLAASRKQYIPAVKEFLLNYKE